MHKNSALFPIAGDWALLLFLDSSGDQDHTQLRMLLCSDSYRFSAMACW